MSKLEGWSQKTWVRVHTLLHTNCDLGKSLDTLEPQFPLIRSDGLPPHPGGCQEDQMRSCRQKMFRNLEHGPRMEGVPITEAPARAS